jgi:hypothetical protein
VWKLRPWGYISWTIWPDSKSTQGPRLPPPGILFSTIFVFEFLKVSRMSCCQKAMFSFFFFFAQPTSPDSLDTSPLSQVRQALRGSPEIFFLVLSSHALPRLYHVICPPVTGFHPRPGEIWPVVSSSNIILMEWLQMAPSQNTPRNSVGR